MTRKDYSITFRVNELTYQQLKQLAEAQGVSLGSVLREILRANLERQS